MHTPVDALLLTRAGRLVLRGAPAAAPAPEDWSRALDVELAALGFVLSHRTRAALAALGPDAFVAHRAWMLDALARHQGADQAHLPLFRQFPRDVPKDTFGFWWNRLLVHLLQAPDQPCLHCEGAGAIRVLAPCGHAVCTACFSPERFAGCPICGGQLDADSPYRQVPPPPRGAPSLPTVPLKRVDVAGHPTEEARRLLASFAARAQAMSPTDVDALARIVAHHGVDVLGWLPPTIPVRENVAHVFGTLLRQLPAVPTLAAAAPWLRTATDLLRVIAVWAGASPRLDGTERSVPLLDHERARWAGAPRTLAERGIEGLSEWQRASLKAHPEYARYWLVTPITSARFAPPKMPRAARRALLAWLDALPEAALAEDLARHASVWIRVAEALHPREHATAYPRAAAAFQALRDNTPPRGFAAVAERLRTSGDAAALAEHLRARPGELWRRADDALRDATDPAPVLAALEATVEAVSLPLLLQVGTHLRARTRRAPVRVYFPAGPTFVAPSARDGRPTLPPALTAPLLRRIDAELLARLGRLPPVGTAVIDAALHDVVVPFNERTAARSAVALPRGSTVAVPEADHVRLFLHWCEPERGERTDIDLSVALYDAAWKHTGVCSYYSLDLGPVAVHSGDYTSAPPPAGSSEFVDLDRRAALAAGHRYAVLVVNAYSGLPFGKLARGFAGVMRRGSADGPVFDPSAVELRFDVAGERHGVYVPLVFDLAASTLTWLDVCSEGSLALNNVETSNAAITRIVPALLAYFASGARPSMFALAQLHAAARAETVWVRGSAPERYTRRPGEDRLAFLERLRGGEPDDVAPLPALDGPVFAALLRGDLALPPGGTAWALFRDRLTDVVAAADLLTVPSEPPGPPDPNPRPAE